MCGRWGESVEQAFRGTDRNRQSEIKGKIMDE